MSPSLLHEVGKAISKLERERAVSLGRSSPNIFKGGSPDFVGWLTDILAKVWHPDVIASDWSQSLIILVYKKGHKSSFDNHTGVSLTNIVSVIPVSVIIWRLSKAMEQRIRENQAGSRHERGFIDQMFTLRQILKHGHSYHRPTIVVFLDLKAAFYSVHQEVLWQFLIVKSVPQ